MSWGINLQTLVRVRQQHADKVLQQKVHAKHTLTLLDLLVRCGVVIPPLPPKICEMSGIGCCLFYEMTTYQTPLPRSIGELKPGGLSDEFSQLTWPCHNSFTSQLTSRNTGNVFLRSTQMSPSVICK